MTSFTKQLRTGTFALENMSLEEAQAVLAEPVATEIEAEVVQPAEQISDGVDAVIEAEADASTLENTAQILEDASGDGAADVDVATSELANITVEAMCRKYGIQRTMKLSKESFESAATRMTTAKSIAKEAEEASKGLRERVSEGIKRIIEWFKSFIASIFDKRTKLEKRFQAIASTAKEKSSAGLESAPEGKTIKLSGAAYVKGDKIVDNIMVLADADVLKKFIDGLKDVSELAKGTSASNNGQSSGVDQDFNEPKFCGVTLKAGMSDGKITVTKEQASVGESKDVKPMAVSHVTQASKDGLVVLAHLKNSEAEFKKVVAEMGNMLQKVKAVATGKEDGQSPGRANILARYQAVTKLSSSISSIALSTLAGIATACEKSMATYVKAGA